MFTLCNSVKTYVNSKKQRIKQWYNNHTRGDTSAPGEHRRVLDLNTKPKRQLLDWQIYSTLYYKDKLKDLIQTEWQSKYLEDHPDHDLETAIPTAPMAYRNEKTREYFEAETEEVKKQVKESRKTDQSASGEDQDMEALGSDEAKRLEKLEMYQR
jgi:hypothetical protein